MLRPRMLTVLAILALLVGLSNLITGAMLITGAVSFEKVFGQVPEIGADVQAEFEQTMKVVVAMFGVLTLAIAWGLWRMQNWARATARGLCVLGLLGALIQMLTAFSAKDAGGFLSYAIAGGAYYAVYFYLGKDATRAMFRRPAAGAPPTEPTAPPDSASGG